MLLSHYHYETGYYHATILQQNLPCCFTAALGWIRSTAGGTDLDQLGVSKSGAHKDHSIVQVCETLSNGGLQAGQKKNDICTKHRQLMMRTQT